VQLCDPDAGLNVPAPHAVQLLFPSPVYPGAHSHSAAPALDTENCAHAEHAVAPEDGMCVAAGQAWHALDPLVAVNVPALHAAHPPAAPANPGKQEQSAAEALP
jgi:hypothetical protein